MFLLMLAFLSGGLGSPPAAEPGVKPFGAFPFSLPGLPAGSDTTPKALLWCHGAKLLGVVVPDARRDRPGVAVRGRPAPAALMLRDGRCKPDGSVSFGFLVPRKAWVFEAPAARVLPEERTTWLLHRFAGAVEAGLLKGRLVQVDVSHPGDSFREAGIEVEALPDDQASFGDEQAWLAGMTREFSLVDSEP